MGANRRIKYIFRLPLITRRMMERSPVKGKEVKDVVVDDAFPGRLYIPSPCLSPCTSPPPLSPCAYDDDACFQLNASHVAVRDCTKEELALDQSTSSSERSCSSCSSPNPSRGRLVRIVSWASIKDRCRWAMEQEKELVFAEHELARCQKAWSSEQELWLAYIKALNDEKEAHEDFIHNRAKQQGDEQHHFRKIWNRRRSSQDQPPTPLTPTSTPTSPKSMGGANKLGRFRGR